MTDWRKAVKKQKQQNAKFAFVPSILDAVSSLDHENVTHIKPCQNDKQIARCQKGGWTNLLSCSSLPGDEGTRKGWTRDTTTTYLLDFLPEHKLTKTPSFLGGHVVIGLFVYLYILPTHPLIVWAQRSIWDDHNMRCGTTHNKHPVSRFGQGFEVNKQDTAFSSMYRQNFRQQTPCLKIQAGV